VKAGKFGDATLSERSLCRHDPGTWLRAGEFRTVQNLGNFGIDRGRKGEHVNFFGAEQRALRNAIRLERRA
jgi:hypothetical protein